MRHWFICARNYIGRQKVGLSAIADYKGEKWVEVYQKSLVELKHAKMRGRIGDARVEIIARVEKLKEIPGLHAREEQAIEDALIALRFLEREEELYDEN